MDKYCVYVHTNKVNGKKYIGQTSQKPEYRWGKNGEKYLRKYKNEKYYHPHFAYAILKYGWENFSHEIIADGLTKEEADNIETENIIKYNTMDSDYGYNLKEGGSHGKLADDVKKRMSESTKGENHPLYGKHHSKETREKISQALKGKPLSDELKKNISKGLMGRKHSQETKDKISKALSEKEEYGVSVLCVETEVKYKNASEAGRILNINNHHILECCDNHRRTIGGYHWIRVKDIDENNWEKQREEILKPKLHLNGQPVICIETQIRYNSASHAQKETKIDASSILKCCNGKAKTAGGFHWIKE